MKKTIFAALCACATLPAQADFTVRNTTPVKYTLTATLADGGTKSGPVYPVTERLGSGSLDLPSSMKMVNLSLVDDLGQTVWSGKMVDEACILVYESGGKVAAAQAGWASLVNQDSLHATSLINVTGQPLKADLLRNTGGMAVPNLDAGSTKLVRLPAEDRVFQVAVKDGSGSVLNDKAGEVSYGNVIVLFKNKNGDFAAGSAGAIRTPGK